MKILITGAEGVVGRVIIPALEKEGHELILLDKSSKNPVNLLKDNLAPYFKGVETTIHLAVNGFWIDEKAAQDNVAMTWNVLEASRKAGVERIVYTSSINVYDYSRLYLEGEKIDSSTPLIPHAKSDWKERKESVFNYSASKILCEDLVKMYHQTYGINAIILRLGFVGSENLPSPNEVDDNAIWLSHEDLVEIVKRSINFKGLENVVCVSNNSENFVDLKPLRNILGYMPQSDSAKIKTQKPL